MPDVSNVKVEDTKKSYESSTKNSHHSSENSTSANSNSTPKPEPPKDPQKKPSTSTNKGNSVTNKQISSFLNKNIGKIGLYSAGAGVAKAFIDSEDDDLLTTVGKAAKTSILTTSATKGVEYALEHLESKDMQLMDLFKETTVADLSKAETQVKAQQVLEKKDIESRSKKVGGKLGTIWKIGLVAAAGATAIDTISSLNESRMAKKEQERKEYELKKKQKDRDKKNSQYAYGAMQDGEMLFELFDKRTGHHKMGNAKFM